MGIEEAHITPYLLGIPGLTDLFSALASNEDLAEIIITEMLMLITQPIRIFQQNFIEFFTKLKFQPEIFERLVKLLLNRIQNLEVNLRAQLLVVMASHPLPVNVATDTIRTLITTFQEGNDLSKSVIIKILANLKFTPDAMINVLLLLLSFPKLLELDKETISFLPPLEKHIPPQAELSLKLTLYDILTHAFQAVNEIPISQENGKMLVTPLLSTLGCQSDLIRGYAARILGKLVQNPTWSETAVSTLISTLDQFDDNFTRICIYESLSNLTQAHPPALTKVMSILFMGTKHEIVTVRCTAIRSLNQLFYFQNVQNSIIDILLERLNDENNYVKMCSIEVLGKQLFNPDLVNRIIPFLLGCCKHEDNGVKYKAILALGSIALSEKWLALFIPIQKEAFLEEDDDELLEAAIEVSGNQVYADDTGSHILGSLFTIIMDSHNYISKRAIQSLEKLLARNQNLVLKVVQISLSSLDEDNEQMYEWILSLLKKLSSSPKLVAHILPPVVEQLREGREDKIGIILLVMNELLQMIDMTGTLITPMIARNLVSDDEIIPNPDLEEIVEKLEAGYAKNFSSNVYSECVLRTIREFIQGFRGISLRYKISIAEILLRISLVPDLIRVVPGLLNNLRKTQINGISKIQDSDNKEHSFSMRTNIEPNNLSLKMSTLQNDIPKLQKAAKDKDPEVRAFAIQSYADHVTFEPVFSLIVEPLMNFFKIERGKDNLQIDPVIRSMQPEAADKRSEEPYQPAVQDDSALFCEEVKIKQECELLHNKNLDWEAEVNFYASELSHLGQSSSQQAVISAHAACQSLPMHFSNGIISTNSITQNKAVSSPSWASLQTDTLGAKGIERPRTNIPNI